MADYTRKQLDVDGSYVFPYTHADAVLYTTQNNLDGITSGTETNVKAVLDALDNTYRRLDANITSLYNSQGKRGFLYLNGTTTTASMELPTQGNDFYVPTLKYDSNGNITTAWQTPASIAAAADLSGYLPLTGGTLTGDITVNKNSYTVLTGNAVVNGLTAKANNITVGFGISTGGVSRGIYDYNNSKWLIYSDGTNTNLSLGNVNISGDTKVTGKVMVGTGGTNSYLASDSATNIYLHNSSGAVLVCDGLAVRRGTTLTNATLGTSTYPWLALYATTVYENGSTLANTYAAKIHTHAYDELTGGTSVDNTVLRFDGTQGQIQSSGVTIDDSDNITATKFITSGGSNKQFVTGDGSLLDNIFLSNNYFATDAESLYISPIMDGLWAADKRLVVTGVLTKSDNTTVNLSAGDLEKLFDGDSDTYYTLSANSLLVLTISSSNPALINIVTYPKGQLLVNFYDRRTPEAITGRYYVGNSNSLTWETLNFSRRRGSVSGTYISDIGSISHLRIIELTITGKSSGSTYLSGVEWFKYVQKVSQYPFVHKYGTNTLYYNLTAPKFITSGGTASLFVKGDGSLDSNTYVSTSSNTFVKKTGDTMTGRLQTTTVANLNCAFAETRTDGASVMFGVGSGNCNHGIYSNSLNKWLIYADSTDTTNKRVYVNNTSIPYNTTLVSTNEAQSITGEKTFTGDKRIKFKQYNSGDKLGFTLYNSSNIEVGFLEWQRDSINSKPGLMLGQWVSTTNSVTPGYLGFKVVNVTTAARYALVTPLLADAKTPLSLNDTLKLFYFPLLFKNGTNTVTTANTGVVDLSTLMPTANVSTSAVIASSSSSTTQITATQSDPYYNLIEGSTVARSIRFVAGTGINISAATDGQITITNTVGSSSITAVSSVLASSSTGTSAISGDTLNPYYNLLVNSAVNSSVLFKAGTNISVTAGTDNSITFANTLTNMALLTNNLFVNGTQTGTTNSWKGKLPAEITSLYNGLTIFYRLPYAGNSSNASLQLYAQDGTTTIGANCPVYGGNTRLTTHYPLYSIIRMTYYNGEWRANPYYNSNSTVSLANTTASTYRPIILGYQDNASYSGIPTTTINNTVYKTTNATICPAEARMYLSSSTANVLHGYFTRFTTSGHTLGLAIGTDGIERGLRDGKNGTWLCYCDDASGESLKVPGTLIPQVINLAAHCLIAYDSTNQCINFTFI